MVSGASHEKDQDEENMHLHSGCLGPYNRTIYASSAGGSMKRTPRHLEGHASDSGQPRGVGQLLMSEVPLYTFLLPRLLP